MSALFRQGVPPRIPGNAEIMVEIQLIRKTINAENINFYYYRMCIVLNYRLFFTLRVFVSFFMSDCH